jgi:arginase
MKGINIIEVKSEIGAGTRGASLGPDAIEIAALDFGSNFFRQFPKVEVPVEKDALFEPARTPFARRARSVYGVCERVASEVKRCISSDLFPIVLSGDHSSAAGTIAGIRQAYPQGRIGVIWIDAHADLHSPYTTPSGNMHGMPLAAALAEDNEILKINNPDDTTREQWEMMKSLGGTKPMVHYRNLVYVGLRDYEREEDYLMKQNKIRVFTTDEINNFGTEKVGREILAAIEPCEHIYISFDVDSMDSSISKGTGTPVPNGITEKQAAALILRLMQNEKVRCFEITEVNPTLDKENLMAENAFEILQKVTNQMVNEFDIPVQHAQSF